MAIFDAAAGRIEIAALACPRAPSRRSAGIIRRRSASNARSATCIGHRAAWARWTPRPWLDHGRWAGAAAAGSRRPREAAPGRLSVPAGRRRGPAPDPGRPGACRHHRARTFPLHLQRRNRRAPGRAARLCAQGHRGADARRRVDKAARLAGRISGDSTVAYASRSPRAVEAALGVAPPRARSGCARVMAELERIANHLGDIGAICNDAAFALDARALRRAARTGAARAPTPLSAIG